MLDIREVFIWEIKIQKKDSVRNRLILLLTLFFNITFSQINFIPNGSLELLKNFDSLNYQYFLKNQPNDLMKVIPEDWELYVCSSGRVLKKEAYDGKAFLLLILSIDSGDETMIFNASVLLNKSLERGKQYQLKFFIKPYQCTRFAKAISVAFTDSLIPSNFYVEYETKNFCPYTKTIPRIDIDLKNEDKYEEVILNYTAKGNENYLSIGNFECGHPKKMIRNKRSKSNQITIQYLVDQVSLIEIGDTSHSILQNEIAAQEIKKEKIEKAIDSIFLGTIFFQYNSDSVLSFDVKLESMEMFQTAVIYIYTDTLGSEKYNIELSIKRIKKTMAIIKGLENKRVVSHIITNTNMFTKKGDISLNRRTEIFLRRGL